MDQRIRPGSTVCLAIQHGPYTTEVTLACALAEVVVQRKDDVAVSHGV